MYGVYEPFYEQIDSVKGIRRKAQAGRHICIERARLRHDGTNRKQTCLICRDGVCHKSLGHRSDEGQRKVCTWIIYENSLPWIQRHLRGGGWVRPTRALTINRQRGIATLIELEKCDSGTSGSEELRIKLWRESIDHPLTTIVQLVGYEGVFLAGEIHVDVADRVEGIDLRHEGRATQRGEEARQNYCFCSHNFTFCCPCVCGLSQISKHMSTFFFTFFCMSRFSSAFSSALIYIYCPIRGEL